MSWCDWIITVTATLYRTQVEENLEVGLMIKDQKSMRWLNDNKALNKVIVLLVGLMGQYVHV